MRYQGPAATAWVAVDLDSFTAVFHRESGITHLLVEPAPQLLAALADRMLDRAELRTALAATYDLPDLTDDGLAARLDELVATGLVAAV